MLSAVEHQSRRNNVAYAVTLLLLGLLGTWWTILIARLVEENHALRLALHGPTAQVLAEYSRKRLMLIGESVSLSVLTLVLAGLMVGYARRERAQVRRLEGVLAASTHELKTPIAGVKALLESLQSGVLPPDRMGPYLEKGLASTDRLEHLVEGILAYQAAVVRRGADLEVRPLATWVEGVLDHRLGSPGEDSLAVHLGECAAIPVRCAPDPFRVILDNLLDNAKKYGNGTEVRLGARVDGDRVALDVTDAGVGFAPEEADALFEPYQRGAGVEHRRGTGLGLYIARTLARSLEGDLRAESAGPGHGATFTVWLRRVE